MNLFEYGLVVASDALAQFLFSPLLGATIDRLRSVRLVCLLCSALFCGGNVFYALLGAFPQGEVKIRVWMMLVARWVADNLDMRGLTILGMKSTCNVHMSGLGARTTPVLTPAVHRFVVGSGTTINACARYYVTAATLLSERTTHIALFSLCQTLGFILGPGVMVRSRTALCRIKLSFQNFQIFSNIWRRLLDTTAYCLLLVPA